LNEYTGLYDENIQIIISAYFIKAVLNLQYETNARAKTILTVMYTQDGIGTGSPCA